MSENAPSGPTIGFLAGVDHDSAQGIEDGLELFARADELGYDVGYVQCRHLQSLLASPLLFLVAAGDRAPRMSLGTAVIPLWFEGAARLAEDLATADLLLGGRLRPGVSSGYSARTAQYAGAFGVGPDDPHERVDRTLRELIELLEGTVVATADTHLEDVAPGTPLTLRPHAPGLRDRLAYGAGHPERAARAGAMGLGLQLATLQGDDGSGRSFEELQVEAIEAYREASSAAGHGDGHVSVLRRTVPVADEDELERFTALLPRERSRDGGGDAELRGAEIGGRPAVFSRLLLDTAEVVADALRSDRAVAAADEIVLSLPFPPGAAETRSMLTTFAEQVAPQLRGA